MWPLCSNTQEMLRPDIPSPQLHSFPVTETEPVDNLTLSSRCAWLFIRTGVSVPVPPPDAGGVKHWRLLMLVIMVQEEKREEKREEEKMGEVEARGKKKKERLHEFRSLVKLGSRGVALCDDKQSGALCLPSLCLSQATARPETLPRCVVNLCLAAYYLLFGMQISEGAVRSENIWWTLTSCNASYRHLRFTRNHSIYIICILFFLHSNWLCISVILVISASPDGKTTFPKENVHSDTCY